MGIETGTALVLSSLLGAGAGAIQAKKSRDMRKRMQAKADEQAKRRREAEFQESERQLAAQRGQSRFEQGARQQQINKRLQSQNITPSFTDLSSSILNRTV